MPIHGSFICQVCGERHDVEYDYEEDMPTVCTKTEPAEHPEPVVTYDRGHPPPYIPAKEVYI